MTELIDMPTLAEIRKVISNRPRSMKLEDIANAADVSYSWLQQVLSGNIPHPSYERIRAICAYVKANGSQ